MAAALAPPVRVAGPVVGRRIVISGCREFSLPLVVVQIVVVVLIHLLVDAGEAVGQGAAAEGGGLLFVVRTWDRAVSITLRLFCIPYMSCM